MSGPQPPSRGEQADSISEETVRIHDDSYEQELTSVETVVNQDMVASVLRYPLTPAEEVVIAAGRADAVHAGRHESELALEPVLRAAVERATGRTVTRFLTQTHLEEQGLVVEFYTLAPAGHPR